MKTYIIYTHTYKYKAMGININLWTLGSRNDTCDYSRLIQLTVMRGSDTGSKHSINTSDNKSENCDNWRVSLMNFFIDIL